MIYMPNGRQHVAVTAGYDLPAGPVVLWLP